MIGRLHGVVAEQASDGSCVIDVGGVGYEVFVPLGALGRLPVPPEPVTLHVHTHVREDALLLYGFPTPEDRGAFRALLGVASIGPKLALAILGVLDAHMLAAAVARGDKSAFKGIPGVGKKTVERVLMDLSDKLPAIVAGHPPAAPRPGAQARPAPSNDALAIVSSALMQMGFKQAEADRAIAALGPRDEGIPVETLLREALAVLT